MTTQTKLSRLIFTRLPIVVLLATAPLQTANAGEYEERYPCTDEYEDQDIPQEWSEAEWEVSASATQGNASCAGWMSQTVMHSDPIVGTGGWVEASAYSEHGWQWKGSGTPSGGTLHYSYNVDGSTQLTGDPDGSEGATSSYAAASTEAFGWASGPGETDYVNVDASGSGNWFTQASASLDVSPPSAGGGTVIADVGYFWISAGWGVSVSDIVTIDSGTSEILLEAYASCRTDIWVQAFCFEEGETAQSYAASEVYSDAYIYNETFTPN